MKKIILFASFFYLTLIALASEKMAVGQSPLTTEMLRHSLSKTRAEMFEKAMKDVPAIDQQKFWAIYKSFALEKSELDKKRITLFDQYMTNYLLMTDKQVLELMNRLILLQDAEFNLRVKTFKLLAKNVTPLVATRFYQVDDYLQASLKMEGSNRIPLFGDPIK